MRKRITPHGYQGMHLWQIDAGTVKKNDEHAGQVLEDLVRRVNKARKSSEEHRKLEKLS